jgi:hypothetical protein
MLPLLAGIDEVSMRASMRLIFALSVAVLATPALAIDTGSGVGGKGLSASMKTTTNRSTTYHHSVPGLAPTNIAGQVARIGTTDNIHTNPTQGAAYSANLPVFSSPGGKGFPTGNAVPGRNDPPPNLGGRRHRDSYGGLGM